MKHDVIVIGGSYAGMAAALQLLRARRKVLVIDAGRRRNRMATHSHGFLGQDGADPAAIARIARTQLEAYPTLRWHDGEAVQAEGSKDDFTVRLRDGSQHHARRLLLATGVSDELPAIDGLAERWGRSVFHCPYCHGYELDQGRIGVIAVTAMSLHQAQMLTDWGPTTFLLNGAIELDDDAMRDLVARGVTIEATPIARLDGDADVVLADGRCLAFAGLFTAPRNAPSTPIGEQLGCALMDLPLGTQLQTADTKETTVPGVFACGDVARTPHSVSLAVGDGSWAGVQLHRSLIFPDG